MKYIYFFLLLMISALCVAQLEASSATTDFLPDQSCSICFDDLAGRDSAGLLVTKTPCGNVFHTKCL